MSSLSTLSQIVHRLRSQFVQVLFLVAVTVAAFGVTRAMARHAGRLDLEDAASWHERGRRALEARDVDTAIEAFRRARVKDRGNRLYGLALAGALMQGEQSAAAERVLLSLRAVAPEDPDINVNLARLAARRGDVDSAVRYYQHTLYAPAATAEAPRAVRLELIDLLLLHGEHDRALSELIAATDDLGDDTADHVRVASMLLRAGDATRARQQYEQALALDGSNGQAAAGAGMASFRLGDFAAAVRFLRAAPDSPSLVETRTVAALVLNADPLAPRIRAQERRRRLAMGLEHVLTRVAACAMNEARFRDDPALPMIEADLHALQLRLSRRREDQDLIDDGIAALYRAERFFGDRCADPEPLDRALVIIAERHGAGDA